MTKYDQLYHQIFRLEFWQYKDFGKARGLQHFFPEHSSNLCDMYIYVNFAHCWKIWSWYTVWYPGTINRGFLLTASRVITMIIFDKNHLQGATRQGAGKVIQAGAGQVTFRFDEKSYFLFTHFFLQTKTWQPFSPGAGGLFLTLWMRFGLNPEMESVKNRRV